jgi:hypothetical protein
MLLYPIFGNAVRTEVLLTRMDSWKSLYINVQKAHYKTSNVRKLEAAIHLYGALSEVYPPAIEKLTTMILHPFPKIRMLVADTLYVSTPNL